MVEKCVGRAASPALEAVLVEVMAEDALETLVADRAFRHDSEIITRHPTSAELFVVQGLVITLCNQCSSTARMKQRQGLEPD